MSSVLKSADELWQERAACKGPQLALFYPPSDTERKVQRIGRERQAKAICKICPVSNECLDYSIRIQEPHGIWGGMNEVERRRILSFHAPIQRTRRVVRRS